MLKFTHYPIGICALDANKLKDAPNGKAAICGLSSFYTQHGDQYKECLSVDCLERATSLIQFVWNVLNNRTRRIKNATVFS